MPAYIRTFKVIIINYSPTSKRYLQFTDSAEKNDSSEVSIDNDTTEAQSAEDGGEVSDAADSKEDNAPSVEVADEPYVPQASIENLQDGTAADDSKEDATVEEKGDSGEQQVEVSKQDDGDSKEDASADEQAAEQGRS